MQKKIFITLLVILSLLIGIEASYAALQIPGKEKLEAVSISVNGIEQATNVDSSIGVLKGFAGNLLSVARFVVSWFALIYIVLIGVNMIISSDDDGVIAKQKKQILYAGFAFLFLIIPDVAYRIFMGEDRTVTSGGNWTSTEGTTFYNTTGAFGVEGFLGDALGFLKVFAFIGAIIMFVWGAFGLIMSRGKDEYKDSAINRLTYGVMGLLFLGIVEVWTRAMGDSNLQKGITDVAGSVFGMALFFAAPVAIFFLILGAYYYITSGGDEDRAKKGKNIFLYTFIASIILLAGGTFLTEFIDLLK